MAYDEATGEEWRTWDDGQRAAYMLGFMNGYRHGLILLALDYPACDSGVAETQANIPYSGWQQLRDSVSQFYTNALNRQVTIPDAIVHVVREINGEPDTALQKNLELIRKTGAQMKAAREKRRRE